MDQAPEEFSGEIKVASRIIDYLSSGLYHSPGACLKELVNNSYDADAKWVDVFVKPDADRIIISDDGKGMNREEFQSHFERISESHKRDGSDSTDSGRPKIGKIGIGFIAANEICEIMEIYSTKQGSTDLLHVFIDFSEMRKPMEERRRENGDIVKADYSGTVESTDTDAHYTQIFLTQVRGEAKNILAGASAAGRHSSLYGLSPEAIGRRLSDNGLKSWLDFDQYSQTMLQVALNVPVPYLGNAYPPDCSEVVSYFETAVANLDFQVRYDGTMLRKPVVFPAEGPHICLGFDFSGNYVKARGYFFVRHGTIQPHELQGLLVRIRNSAVGEYDSSFWGFSPSEASLFQRWVSLEVWADDRLEDAMNIDRRTLREAHPAYVELREAIHKSLRECLKQARSELFQAASEVRSNVAAAKVSESIKSVAAALEVRGSSEAAVTVLSRWDDIASSRVTKRRAMRKYDVPEIYDLVIRAASGVVDASSLDQIIKRLTELIGS